MINGKEKKINRYADWFYMGLSLRESCYSCPFTKIPRSSDITIGDYWGVEGVKPGFADKNGVSLALVHTQQGWAVFDQIKDDVIWFQSDVNACAQPRLQMPEKRPANRDMFWQDMQTYGIPFCSRKYRRPDNIGGYQALKSKVKNAIKRMIKGL